MVGPRRRVAGGLRRAQVPVHALRAGPLAAQVPRGRLVGGGRARVAHPSARLASRRAGELLGRVGDEAAQGRFFDARLAWVADMADGTAGASAGPTGLPNSSRMPPAATPDHDGGAGEGCRPAHVPGRPAGLPACLRVAAGNVVDAATPGRAFAGLGVAGLPASWAPPDAGYWSAGNVRAMGSAGIRFPTRPEPNVRPHERVVAERLGGIRKARNLVAHGGRHARADRSEAELVPGVRGWPCLCLDTRARGRERHRPFARAGRRGPAPEEVHGRMGRMGALVLASTADIAAPDVPGAHCARQRIEQVFDVGKDHASLLPLRVHPEEAPGGHLLPAFRATALLCGPRPGMPAKATPMPQALAAARNQKREACGSKAVTCEPTSSANEPCGAIGAVCPVEIPLPCGKK